jgi:cell division septation protein DedD
MGTVVSAQEPAAAALPALRLIRVVPSSDAGSTTVMLEADGPLPEPEGDSLANPPRVFLDLHGVIAAPTLTRSGRDPLVVRARVARYSDAPLVTRVVFDLSRVSGFRVDASARAEGRLVVTLGGPATPSAAAVRAPAASATPSLPPPQSPTQSPVPVRSSRTAAPAKSTEPLRTPRLAPQPTGRGTSAARAEAYAAQLSALVDRLQALRPVLQSIDRRTEVTADLNAAAAEFEAVGRILMAIKPIAGREATHALLQRACALGARASRTLQDATRAGDATGEWNAASAAAGALLLLDRAIKEIG